jgi:uncharacterized protein (DUF2141 family)
MNRIARRTVSLFALVASVYCAHVQAADLTVVLRDVRAQTGLVKVALVDSQAGWEGQAAPVQATGGPPDGETATYVFKDVAPGPYAVMITHDENGNGKLDTNLIGMPVEGYGFSNNPRVMRKPTWDEARFDLASDQSIDISLR